MHAAAGGGASPEGTGWALPADRVMAQAASENFPVALRWLPSRQRRDLQALYGFARLADDLGDEVGGDRLARLAALEQELDRAYEGRAEHPLLRRMTPMLRERDLPRELFVRLIDANRLDQQPVRVQRFRDLLEYCTLSANPVGRLVLRIFDAATPGRDELSDAICSALQVVEHCQDVAEDHARGRIYLPEEDLERFGCHPLDLGRAPSAPALRSVVALQAERACALLRQGEPLLRELSGGAQLAVTGFVAGGYAALDGLAHGGYDVHSSGSSPRRRDLLRHGLRLTGRARGWRIIG